MLKERSSAFRTVKLSVDLVWIFRQTFVSIVRAHCRARIHSHETLLAGVLSQAIDCVTPLESTLHAFETALRIALSRSEAVPVRQALRPLNSTHTSQSTPVSPRVA